MNGAERLDRAVLRTMRTRGHGPRRDRLVAAYSATGEHAACWFAIGVAGLVHGGPGPARAGARPLASGPAAEETRRRWVRGLQVTAAAYAINTAVKQVVRRPRPPGPALTGVVSGLSFPSAHATTSFAAAGAYRHAIGRRGGALYGAAVMFALSRPYLGVHYPSDVIAGGALGAAIERAWPR